MVIFDSLEFNINSLNQENYDGLIFKFGYNFKIPTFIFLQNHSENVVFD